MNSVMLRWALITPLSALLHTAKQPVHGAH